MKAATKADVYSERRWVNDYLAYEGGSLLVAVYIVNKCGLIAQVEFANKDKGDVLSLYAVNRP